LPESEARPFPEVVPDPAPFPAGGAGALPAFGPVDVRGGVDGFAEPEEPWAGRPWFAESPPARGPDPDSRVSAARFAP
jgi:hypothetical protein